MRISLKSFLLLFLATHASAAPLLWRGDLQSTAVTEATTGACRGGWFPGVWFSGIFQPANLTGNTTQNQFSFFSPISAFQFTVIGGTSASPIVNLNYILKTGGALSRSNQTLTGFLISPTTILATTKTITMQMTVPNVFGNTGCTVAFYGIFQKSI